MTSCFVVGLLLTRKLPSSQKTLVLSRYIHACIRTYVHIYIHTYIYETLSTETRIFCFFLVTGTCRRSLERRSPAATRPFAAARRRRQDARVRHSGELPCQRVPLSRRIPGRCGLALLPRRGLAHTLAHTV